MSNIHLEEEGILFACALTPQTTGTDRVSKLDIGVENSHIKVEFHAHKNAEQHHFHASQVGFGHHGVWHKSSSRHQH